MAGILMGEIRWTDLNPARGNEQAGARPVLARAGFPLTLELTAARLPKRLWVKISQVRTLATERIGRRIGRASPEELAQVIEGLNEILGD
jgi:mRNA interferase MazF